MMRLKGIAGMFRGAGGQLRGHALVHTGIGLTAHEARLLFNYARLQRIVFLPAAKRRRS